MQLKTKVASHSLSLDQGYTEIPQKTSDGQRETAVQKPSALIVSKKVVFLWTVAFWGR